MDRQEIVEVYFLHLDFWMRLHLEILDLVMGLFVNVSSMMYHGEQHYRHRIVGKTVSVLDLHMTQNSYVVNIYSH